MQRVSLLATQQADALGWRLRAGPANAVVNMNGMGLKMELLGSQGTGVAGREARDGRGEEISARVTFTGGSVEQPAGSESVSTHIEVSVWSQINHITSFRICRNCLHFSIVLP